ncbi:MAG: hypothetical protein BWY79_01621 [Actinobacteria bacterium ADurb.Bin444]|nr:MAG: hypothetical protein BWY79_01621 [Actinobacteria bacterium ADurb.Bin444]
MRISAKEQYLSFRRELAAFQADLNRAIGELCDQLVDDYGQARNEIAARIKREEVDGHKKSFCQTTLYHATDKKKPGTHALQWKRARYIKGGMMQSYALKRGKARDLAYPAPVLDKYTPAQFQEMVRRIESEAAWIRRFNRVLVKVREAERALATLDEPIT